MFQENIKKLRIKKNLTQENVAHHLGITRPAYTAYEIGKREPDFKTLTKLATLFDVSTDYLLGNTTQENQAKLTTDEESDIAIEVSNLLEKIESGEELRFFGETATSEQRERLYTALKIAMELNTNKKKED